MLWLQGALRLMPGWNLALFGYTVPNPFFPGVLLPGIVVAVLLAWPFLEARVTGDRETHHLLDRPRDRPVRTAIGAAALTAFVVLLVAGSDDILAVELDWSIVVVRRVERVLLVVLPVLVALVTARVCRDLAARDPLSALLRTPPERPLIPSDPTGGLVQVGDGVGAGHGASRGEGARVATSGPGADGPTGPAGTGPAGSAGPPVDRRHNSLLRGAAAAGVLAAVTGAVADRLRNRVRGH